jgi:hypothetical protein
MGYGLLREQRSFDDDENLAGDEELVVVTDAAHSP